jgi:hypothetical protein
MAQLIDRFLVSIWVGFRGTLVSCGVPLLCLMSMSAQAQQAATGESETGISRQIDGTPVWIVPPSGFGAAAGIPGFIDAEGASIVAVTLPASAFRSLPSSPDELKHGTMLANGKRIIADGERWQLNDGLTGLYVEVEDTSRGVPIRAHMLMIRSDESAIIVIAGMPEGVSVSPRVMTAALHSVRIGAGPNVEQRLAALDFVISDQAGLRIIQTMSIGGIVAFTEGPLDTDPSHLQPLVIVGTESAVAADDRDHAKSYSANLIKRTFPNATVMSGQYEPVLRRYQLDATGQEKGVDLHYLQFISFGERANLRIVCVYRAHLDFANRCARIAHSTAMRR